MLDNFSIHRHPEVVIPLEEIFNAYCKMDPISLKKNVQNLPLSQCNEWFKKAGLLDMKTIATTDMGIYFFKFRKRAINFDEFNEYLKDIANNKRLDLEAMKFKLQSCPLPSNQRDVSGESDTESNA